MPFHPKPFLALFVAFVAATIVGTLSHEAGHWIVARALGYSSGISYASTHWQPPPRIIPDAEYERNRFLLTLGGPLQTILTGTVAWLLLCWTRAKHRHAKTLPPSRWLLILLALFWLREPANLAMWIGHRLLTGVWVGRMDELRLSHALGLPSEALISIAATIGAAVLTDIAFQEVPRAQRFTFFAAGLAGGVFGFWFWMDVAGPALLP